MIAAMFSQLRRVAGTWQEEAGRRRKISGVDPVADTLEHCAGELLAEVKMLDLETARITVEDYARLQGVTPQTVRAWIRRGELEAERTGAGWLIRRGARHTRRLKSVA